MGEEDVLVEVLINGRDILQFFSTPEHYKTLFEDRDALITTVKTAFKDGVLSSEDIKDVEDIQSVRFLNEVNTESVEVTTEEAQVAEDYEEYEIIEETSIENLTSSALPEELIIDVGLSSDERLNLCAYCDYRTFNVGHFKIHLRQHTGEQPFQCNFCEYRSKQKSNLKRHMKQHLEGKDHFECKLCNFTCKQEKMYKRHMVLHSRSRPLRPCPFCDYFSTSLAHLTVHIRQHTGETPYHCGLCSYKTVQKSNLTRHLKKHRGGRISKADKLRCCLYCSYRTPNPAHLMAHVRAAHTGETPYACQHCNYKSAQRSNLKRHLRKHTGERPYHCHLCSYSTAYPYVLKKHIENHPAAEEKYRCEECNYIAFSSMEYKRHLRLHSGKPIHCCHICGYVTLNSDHLKAHLRRHARNRPYKCHYCDYFSTQKSNLKRHLLIKHSGVSQNDEVIKTSNSEEGVLENEKTEILNNDSSNSDHLQEDKLDQNYVGENAEELLECDEEAEIEKEIEKEQSFHDHSAYSNEQTNNPEDHQLNQSLQETGNVNETETVEVVSEEHVITTTMEEGEYEMTEEEYSEGTSCEGYLCRFCSFECDDFDNICAHILLHHDFSPYKCLLSDFQAAQKSTINRHMRKHLGAAVNSAVENPTEETVVEQTRKSKNLSFLNKSQAEKLKEFKRLLQQGTQYTQNGTTSQKLQIEENARQICSSEYDNISENTESCTEDPVVEEDLQESSTPVQESMDANDESSYKSGEKPVSPSKLGPSAQELTAEETERANEVEESSSILIVERTEEDDANNSVEGEVVYEEVYEDGEQENSASICELCGFEAESLSDLKAHIGIHTGETTSLFYCDECSFRSYRKADISRHKSLFHGARPPQRLFFVCGICEYRTASKEEFDKHGERHRIASLKCKICELKLDSQEELQAHNRKHIGEEPFECYHCAYLTARKCHLRKHMRRHTIGMLGGKGPPYECYTCGFQTDHRANFHKHIGKHKIERTTTFTCHYCRFVTLDEEVYKKHLSMHSDGERSDKNTSFKVESSSINKAAEDLGPPANGEIKKGRIPLKEWLINVPEFEEVETGNLPSKAALEKRKHKLDEYYNCTPVKRRRRGLKSIVNNSGTSIIEQRLSRKFNFNIKNLCTSKDIKSGFSVDFCGEVLKSHGCLRKYTNYGDIISKSDNTFGTVLANINSEKQLRIIYDKLKESMVSLKKTDIEKKSTVQFTIFFKEIDETGSKSIDESLSNLDLTLSSDNDSDGNSLNDLDSDLDLDLSPNDDLSSPENKDSLSKIKVEKYRKNGSKSSHSEYIFNLDAADKVKFLQEKIKQRNERMKELRRLKILNVSSRNVNIIRPKREPIPLGLEDEN